MMGGNHIYQQCLRCLMLNDTVANNILHSWEKLKPEIVSLDQIMENYHKDDDFRDLQNKDNLVFEIGIRFINLGRVLFKLNRKPSFTNNKQLEVVRSSKVKGWKNIVRWVLTYIAELSTEGKSDRTIFYTLDDAVIRFLCRYRDKINFNSPTLKAIKACVSDYHAEMNHQVKIYDKSSSIGLGVKSAMRRYSVAVKFFVQVLNLEDSSKLTFGLKPIKANHNQKQSAQPLSETQLTYEFNFFTKLFRQLSSIVLDEKILPCKVNLADEDYWLMPVRMFWMKSKLSPPEFSCRGFNYQTGKIPTFGELRSEPRHSAICNTELRNSIQKAVNATSRENAYYSYVRKSLAAWSCKAYFMHFLIITGENDSTAATLLFSKDYKTSKHEVNFKSIKWRSNGQEVNYKIQNEFIEDFKRYLQIREYLVSHHDPSFEKLFIGSGTNRLTALNSGGQASSKLRLNFIRFLPEADLKGTSRTFRVSKSIWVRNSYGSQVSAYVLQHQLNSSLDSYTGQNDEQTAEEFTDFFEKIDEQIKQHKNPQEKETSVGACSEENIPIHLFDQNIALDCSKSESCLFCSKYVVHSDEKDIRKLLSLKYLIEQTEALAVSKVHFNEISTDVLKQIDSYIERITSLNTDLVDVTKRVTKEVYEDENLSPYFLKKLELLEQLGVL